MAIVTVLWKNLCFIIAFRANASLIKRSLCLRRICESICKGFRGYGTGAGVITLQSSDDVVCRFRLPSDAAVRWQTQYLSRVDVRYFTER